MLLTQRQAEIHAFNHRKLYIFYLQINDFECLCFFCKYVKLFWTFLNVWRKPHSEHGRSEYTHLPEIAAVLVPVWTGSLFLTRSGRQRSRRVGPGRKRKGSVLFLKVLTVSAAGHENKTPLRNEPHAGSDRRPVIAMTTPGRRVPGRALLRAVGRHPVDEATRQQRELISGLKPVPGAPLQGSGVIVRGQQEETRVDVGLLRGSDV